jgi:hypothetical protein
MAELSVVRTSAALAIDVAATYLIPFVDIAHAFIASSSATESVSRFIQTGMKSFGLLFFV